MIILKLKCLSHGDAFILIYSIVEKSTYYDLVNLYEQILLIKDSKPRVVVVGAKCDMEKERQVKFSEGLSLAENFNCSFFETSAKCNYQVEDVFQHITKQLLKAKRTKKAKCIIM